MPTATHEKFIGSIRDEISAQLKLRAKQSDTLGDWLKNIESRESTTVGLSSGNSSHLNQQSSRDPDTSFGHEDAAFLGLVIEVAYTQKSRELPKAAEDYILDTNGNVQMVVGFDTKNAKMYIWRPNLQVTSEGGYELSSTESLQTVSTGFVRFQKFLTTKRYQVFRNSEGVQNESAASLTITPADFANRALQPPDHMQEVIVTITPQQMCLFLHKAERLSKSIECGGSADVLPPQTKKRRRESTPPEEITSRDEAAYHAQETLEEERAAQADKDWVPGDVGSGERRIRRRQ